MSRAKESFLTGGGLVNDIDSEANPISRQNNQWREYAKALDEETSNSHEEEEVVGYQDFGAKAALTNFDNKRRTSSSGTTKKRGAEAGSGSTSTSTSTSSPS